MAYLLKVGAAEGADPNYADGSAFEFYVFDTREEAEEMRDAVLAEWAKVPAEDFVYGTPEAEVIEVFDLSGDGFRILVQALAENWHRGAEDCADDAKTLGWAGGKV